MKQIGFVVVLALGALVATVADAQAPVRLRGTITAVDGNTLSVRSREGENLALQMPDNVAVAVAKAVRFEDIKQGDYVGATTRKQPDGSMVAIEVHYLPPDRARRPDAVGSRARLHDDQCQRGGDRRGRPARANSRSSSRAGRRRSSFRRPRRWCAPSPERART